MPTLTYCYMSLIKGAATGVTFGNGDDGDLVLNANKVYFIEDLFPSYNWASGVVPHYKDVTLTNGASLSVRDKFNDDAGHPVGGVLMFYVSGTLTICATCKLDVNAKGWSGGADQFGTGPYGQNVRNNNGKGRPGGTIYFLCSFSTRLPFIYRSWFVLVFPCASPRSWRRHWWPRRRCLAW